MAEKTLLASLLKVTIFTTAFDYTVALREVLFRYYGAHLPASSLVEVSRLFSPDLHIEIEAIMAL
nr:Glutamate dehydrogenase [Candidatus Pantoea persica]